MSLRAASEPVARASSDLSLAATLRLLLLVAAVVSIVAAGAVSAATLQEIKTRGYIVVATEDNNPPFDYAVNGGRAGFDHDLLVKFTQSTGIAIRQQVVPLRDIVRGVASGKYDAAATSIVVSRGRAKSVDFTMPTAEITLRYIKRADDKSIAGIKDLSGKTIGVQRDGPSADAVPQLRDVLHKSGGKLGKVVEYDSYAEAYRDLVRRKIDAVLNNSDALTQLARATSGIFETGEPIGGKEYAAWAVKKGNRELLDYLNGFLAEQKKNGTLAELQRKYQLSVAELPDQPFAQRKR